MNMVDIIQKKRDGKKLSTEEINYFVESYTKGDIPDYQASALLMAIYFSKMNKEETVDLTHAIKESGDVIDLSSIAGIKVDKHSTGGVGDKTTLITAPIAAACGVPIAKMSGRGLGFTGGTIDKLESIPGFRTELSPKEFTDCVNKNGISIIGQSAQIAKADKLLYALRDVTATMENISLIAASVMSKKLAAGSDTILLDVKCGSGAFMSSLEDAKSLSKLMVEIGDTAGKKTVAVISDMSQPLGKNIGNSLEVIEAIDVLKGKGPDDIRELSIFLAGLMIQLGGKADDHREGMKKALTAIEDGSALESFRKLVEEQGGDCRVIEDYCIFPQANHKIDIVSDNKGYVNKIDTALLGKISQKIGAGRITKDDQLDLSAGITLHVKLGGVVDVGASIATLYGNDLNRMREVILDCTKAFRIGKEPCQTEPLIKEIIGLSTDSFS